MEPRLIAGRYELLEPVGSGWRAVDTELEREVLVRLLAPGEQSPVAAAAMLAHESVARVFDQGEADGESYVVLEYLPGGSLEERLPELDEREAYAVAAGIASALAHAHSRGVAHGSLSTASVFLDGEGRAKVVGFGATGEPVDDVRAFGQILTALGAAAPALAALAPVALAGELDSAELLEQLGPAPAAPAPTDETTLIQRPPPAARRRPYAWIAVAAAVALLAAGVGAAILATSGDSTTDGRTTGQLSVPSSATSTESTPAATDTQPETTTAATTTTSGQATTTPAPQPTAPAASTAPPPTNTQPPAPTTEPSPSTEPVTTEAPPATTEVPPPATTDVPPPTAATTGAEVP